jgi:NtrC-family two-component system response regulator AlgB
LLRFLQDRQYERVGDSITRQADVRMVTATNVDLEQAVRAGKFRQDLFYRINVVQIDLPPLRQRAEDIPALAERFLAEIGKGRTGLEITPEALAALRDYNWPGNIRELRNVIERAVILSPTGRIGLENLPTIFHKPLAPAENVGDFVSLDKLEEMHIRQVLAKTTSLEDAAQILGIDLATLWRRRKKYQI